MTHKGGAVQCTIYMSGSVCLTPHQDLAQLESAMSDKKDVNGRHKCRGHLSWHCCGLIIWCLRCMLCFRPGHRSQLNTFHKWTKIEYWLSDVNLFKLKINDNVKNVEVPHVVRGRVEEARWRPSPRTMQRQQTASSSKTPPVSAPHSELDQPIELPTRVHTRVRKHGEGPYY